MTFTPYVVGTDKDFDACLPDIEIQEGVKWTTGTMPKGAFSDDKHDPGGKTVEGITQKEYFEDLRAWGLPLAGIVNMTKDQERTIYYTRYWLPYCPKLPDPGMKLEFFNMNVNAGVGEAIRLLQHAMLFSTQFVDGKWGPRTLDGINAIRDGQLPDVIARFKADCDTFYKSIPGFKWFGKDWLRRDNEIEVDAKGLDAALDAILKPQPSIIRGGPNV
jgi:lysozyme family protein